MRIVIPMKVKSTTLVVRRVGLWFKIKKAKGVDALFEQAKQSAVERPVEPSRSASTSFTGASRLLCGEPVPAAPQQQQQQQQQHQNQPHVVVHNITFWRNGFTAIDGPLKSFDDPPNATFMEFCLIRVVNSRSWI